MADLVPDNLDRALIEALAADPRQSYVAIGKRVGVSGTTVAARLDRLRDGGLLSIQALPDLERWGLASEILGTVEVEAAAIAEISALLTKSPYVLRADHVTGDFNLSFLAAFPSDSVLGAFLRALQTTAGVRRVVVHHVLEPVKRADGWSAVLSPSARAAAPSFEIMAGTAVPKHLEPYLPIAAAWAYAYVAGDPQRLREISLPNLVLHIMRPRAAAGTFEGLDAVVFAGRKLREHYQRWWYRIVTVAETEPPYLMLVDALSPAEDHEGRLLTIFSRVAYGIEDGKVARVAIFGAMQLEAAVAELPPGAQRTR